MGLEWRCGFDSVDIFLRKFLESSKSSDLTLKNKHEFEDEDLVSALDSSDGSGAGRWNQHAKVTNPTTRRYLWRRRRGS